MIQEVDVVEEYILADVSNNLILWLGLVLVKTKIKLDASLGSLF